MSHVHPPPGLFFWPQMWALSALPSLPRGAVPWTASEPKSFFSWLIISGHFVTASRQGLRHLLSCSLPSTFLCYPREPNTKASHIPGMNSITTLHPQHGLLCLVDQRQALHVSPCLVLGFVSDSTSGLANGSSAIVPGVPGDSRNAKVQRCSRVHA